MKHIILVLLFIVTAYSDEYVGSTFKIIYPEQPIRWAGFNYSKVTEVVGYLTSSLQRYGIEVVSTESRTISANEIAEQLSGITSDSNKTEIGEFSNAQYILTVNVNSSNYSLQLINGTTGAVIKVVNEVSYLRYDMTSINSTVFDKSIKRLLGITKEKPIIYRRNSVGIGIVKRYSSVAEGIGLSASYKHSGRAYSRVKSYFSIGGDLTINSGDLSTYTALDDEYYWESNWYGGYQADLTDTAIQFDYTVDNLTNMNFYIGGGLQYIILEAGVSIDITKMTSSELYIPDGVEEEQIFPGNKTITSVGFIVRATTMVQTLRGNSINFSLGYSNVAGQGYVQAGVSIDITSSNYGE